MNTQDAYDLGVKLAVARWREAIRSGELAPETAERLKEQMGLTPQRMTEGLNLGSKNIAKRLGYKFKFVPEARGETDLATKTILLPKRSKTLEYLGRRLESPGHYPVTRPQALGPQELALVRRHEVDEALQIEKEVQRALRAARRTAPQAVARSGEVREVLPVFRRRKPPRGPKPSKYVSPAVATAPKVPGWLGRMEVETTLAGRADIASPVRMPFIPQRGWRPSTPGSLLLRAKLDRAFRHQLEAALLRTPEGRVEFLSTSAPVQLKGYAGHMSPEVPLKELRESRMFSPLEQERYNLLRRATGEMEHISAATGGAARPVIPKQNIRRIARRILGMVYR